MITEGALIKGGAMVATGSMMAELIIFHDPMYGKLALVGAVVSASGVIHELANDTENHNLFSIFGEILKGIMLGFLAIPFWFLLLSGVGDGLIVKLLDVQDANKMEKSLWLIIAFGLAWYTVPIYNWIGVTVKAFGTGVIARVKKVINNG